MKHTYVYLEDTIRTTFIRGHISKLPYGSLGMSLVMHLNLPRHRVFSSAAIGKAHLENVESRGNSARVAENEAR